MIGFRLAFLAILFLFTGYYIWPAWVLGLVLGLCNLSPSCSTSTFESGSLTTTVGHVVVFLILTVLQLSWWKRIKFWDRFKHPYTGF